MGDLMTGDPFLWILLSFLPVIVLYAVVVAFDK
jgi:hypothetical protein